MARGELPIDHLLRRAGFGANIADFGIYAGMSMSTAIETLVEYERLPDEVDSKIGQAEYVGVTTRGQFSPDTNIDDARQRWLFRMVHSQRPLQERMTLFWHNHFGVGYSKVAGPFGALQGTKMMALKSGALPGPRGHIELLRYFALGKFRELLLEVARDPAMLVFLDGRANTKEKPQENFGREVMELFTVGVGSYTEQDVYAAARVFTGWNLRRVPGFDNNNDPNSSYEFAYNAAQHETAAKTFTFPVMPDGGRTIPARGAADGAQDGVDFINAISRHPATARRLALKLWNFFVSDLSPAPAAFLNAVSEVYLRTDTNMKEVVSYILRSSWFLDRANYFTRYSWPAEFVARSIKETGWEGFSVDSARTPMTNMGQTLFEPPDVSGWELGEAWFSSGAMLARLNFAATLASNQKFNLAKLVPAASRTTPDRLVEFFLSRLSAARYDSDPYAAMTAYVSAGAAYTGSDTQVATKAPSIARLILGSSEYQFV
ncbi:MAG: DUF1800 domain-containing protein [Vicinamibacterales bacterium]